MLTRDEPRPRPCCTSRRGAARLHPRAAGRRRAGHPGPRPRLPGRGRDRRARRPAGDLLGRPGHALRRARRPARYDQVFAAWFDAPRRAAARPARATPTRPAAARPRCPRPRATAAPASPTTRTCSARWPAQAEVLRHRDVADADAAEKRRLAAMFATLPPRPPVPSYRPAPARWHRGDLDASRTLRASLRRMGEPGEIAWRRRGIRPRRVVLLVDVRGSMSAVRRRAAAARAPLHPVRRATAGRQRRDLHRRHPADPRDPGAAAPRRRPRHRRGRRDGARLVRRHPARRDAAGLPRPLGPARDGARRGGRHLQRRLGARRRRAARRADGAACTGSPTGSSGSTRTAARRATSRCSRAWWPRCRTATTSSPGTRWRPSPSSTEVIGTCVTCCPS